MTKKLEKLPIEPGNYLNREISWLRFNERVLAEAENPKNPLLERAKFLAIFESNLDEFYMVRVSGFIDQRDNGVTELTPDGLTPTAQLQLIREYAQPLRKRASACLQQLLKELAAAGLVVRKYAELSKKQQDALDAHFAKEVFPVCTPLKLYPSPSVPFISNRSLNLVVELDGKPGQTRLARVKIPTVVSRLVRIKGTRNEFALLEDVIRHNLGALFRGETILGAYEFRVIRDADIEIRELEAADLLSSVEESIRRRRFGDPVLLQCEASTPKPVLDRLLHLLELTNQDLFLIDSMIGMEVLWELYNADRPSLRYPPHVAYLRDSLSTPSSLLASIASRDVLVHHPFDSFRTVQAFFDAAAKDTSVIGIKATLYRVGSSSPVVESLLSAAQCDKQVTAMVELKARFDESNNLVWSRALERAGVHVTYGFPEMKTHCKLCQIVRREQGTIKSYAHIGTGNYNPVTARQYTDLGLFTDDPEVNEDVSELFNFLTGYSKQTTYRKLLVAPYNLREGIIERIEREAAIYAKTKKGRIVFKLNSLVDPEVVDALYEAQKTGLPVDLIVRGICCLRPGVEGMSDRIRVISIVGRFLEHSRIYYFENGGKPEALIGSADLMRRNLDRRIEVLVPVEDPAIVDHLLNGILEPCLRDNLKAWALRPDGTYVRCNPKPGEIEFDAQRFLIGHPSTKVLKR